MFLVSTRNFPPGLGGMQNLMEGLSNALLNHGPVKVFAETHDGDKNYDQNSKLKTLVSLINSAKLIIANDTGPAHIASHLDKKGLVLFGSHTSAKKVSIENFNFKAISVKNLNDLEVNTVLKEVKAKLD